MAGELEPEVLRLVIGLLSIGTILLAYPAIQHVREQPSPPPPPFVLSLAAPPDTEFGSGDVPLDAAISPDQREVVFVATETGTRSADRSPPGTSLLWRQPLGDGRAVRIRGTEGARFPAWKQTGNVLAFFADERLRLANLRTGELASLADAPAPAGATWLRDGSLLFVSHPGPVRRLLHGRLTDATRLMQGDVAHVFPLAVGAADAFTYVAVRANGGRIVRLNEAGAETDLGRSSAHAALLESGWGLRVEGDTLIADHRDPEQQRAWGRDIPVALNVGSAAGRAFFVASADLLLHAPAAKRQQRVVWLDMRGAELASTGDAGDYWQLRLSADDRNVAVTARDALLQSLDIIRVPAAGHAPVLRLTRALAADTDPVWSDDGTRLLFRSMQRGRSELYMTRAESSTDDAAGDQDTPVPANIVGEIPTDWRGRERLVQLRANGNFDLVRVNDNGGAAAVANSSFNETDGRWSPDGRWIAYVSDEFGRPDIYVQDVAGARHRVSSGGGTHPRWARDGRTLLFLRESQVMRAGALADGSGFEYPQTAFVVPGIRDFDVARRSDRIVAIVPAHSERVQNLWVIVNWRSLLRRPADPL